MGVWTALVMALQLLLCLDVEAQVLGECQPCEVSNSDSDDHFEFAAQDKIFPAVSFPTTGKCSSSHWTGCDVILHFH